MTLLLSYAAAVFLVSGTGVMGTLAENLHNIVYWVKSSGDVWHIAFKNKLLPLPGALCLLAFALLVLAFAAQWLLKNRTQRHAPFVLGLILLQAVFLTKLYSLPSFPVNHYFIWPSIILLIMIVPEQPWARTLNAQLTDFWRAETMTGYYISTGYKEVPGLVLLLLVLAIKPSGLFGKAAIKKV